MNTITSGIILAVYCFVIITIYVFISGPFDQMVTGIQDVNMTESDSQVENSSALIRPVFDMVFGGMIIAPIIWFVYVTFVREPDWGFRQ